MESNSKLGPLIESARLEIEKLDQTVFDDWHLELLNLAAQENETSHPAIISDSTRSTLNRLRGFRHVARTHYGLEMDVEKILPLLDDLTSVWTALRSEVEAFLEFAGQQIR
jgi:hypothetical protein